MATQEQLISKTDDVYLLVIAGGQGTRLFPISHASCPKQFCRLDDNDTFIQATVKRFVRLGVKLTNVIVIVTNQNQQELAEEQLVPMGILSQNIRLIKPTYDYAGAMIKGAGFIAKLSSNPVIINTPSDQHIIANEGFANSIAVAIESARVGNPTIIGVKTTDLNTVRGCGHARFDTSEDTECRKVVGFIEKPSEVEADKIMRSGDTACNTGINVWNSRTVLMAAKSLDVENGVKTDALMATFGDKLRVIAGDFGWYDCGTLKALYQISQKTPNHRNANLGDGMVSREDCRRSLFWAAEGYSLHAIGVRDSAVVVNTIEGQTVVAVVAFDSSQKVKELADDFLGEKLLMNNFSLDANNNNVARSNIDDLTVVFMGVSNHVVAAVKNSADEIVVVVSNNK